MWGDQNFANAFGAISKEGKAAEVLAAATGGRHVSFFRQNTTERLITEIGEELHTQYVLSFRPAASSAADSFRPIQVAVANRPDLTVRTRTGYWFTGKQ